MRSISESRFWEARSLPGERVRGRKFARGAAGWRAPAGEGEDEEEEESGGGGLVVWLFCFDAWDDGEHTSE